MKLNKNKSDTLKRFTFEYQASYKGANSHMLTGSFCIDERPEISYTKLMNIAMASALNSFEYDHDESREDYIVNIVIQAS